MKFLNQCGRSMVEMLGVLAIIGVLSVGGIAGYSKAMEKYKLNILAEQYSNMISQMAIYRDQYNGDFFSLFTKLHSLPDHFVKKNGNYQDIFGNSLNCFKLWSAGCAKPQVVSGCNYAGCDIKISPNTSNKICQTLLSVVKEHSSYIWFSHWYRNNEENTGGYSTSIYGDKYCTSKNQCLKNLTLDQIDEACKRCDPSKYTTCTFRFTL